LGTAADVVEAIDNPHLQQQRGWDLSCWRYDLVPWGVRFRRRELHSSPEAEVLAVLAFDSPPAIVLGDGVPQGRQKTVVLFGH